MTYSFFDTLSESRLIPSKSTFRIYDAEALSNLTVIYLCALYIMYNNKSTSKSAMAYARRTLQYGINFSEWHTGGTDLYVLIYGLKVDDVELNHPAISDRFKSTLPLRDDMIVRWLREMNSGHLTDSTHRQLFTRMDFNMKTSDNSIRAIRRLVMDWKNLTESEYRLAMTRMLQIIRIRAPRCELLGDLHKVSDTHNLEIRGAYDKDSGLGYAPAIIAAKTAEPSKDYSFLRGIAAVGIGLAASNLLHKATKK
jgi:hypothetical protein